MPNSACKACKVLSHVGMYTQAQAKAWPGLNLVWRGPAVGAESVYKLPPVGLGVALEGAWVATENSAWQRTAE